MRQKLLASLFLMKSAQYVAAFLHINVGVGANATVAAVGSMAMGYVKRGGAAATHATGFAGKRIGGFVMDKIRGK